MEDLKKLAQQLLEQGRLIHLGTNDDGGVWVSPLIYIHDEAMNIYWLSMPVVRHSRAVDLAPQAAAAIMVDTPDHKAAGLQIAGTVTVVNQDEQLAKNYLAKYHLPDDHIDDNHKWYKLSPKFIDIIYEPLFGWKKQKIEF
ncbi:MAG: pyridoxamine 5'-phosphate oxidase family protein [Candidatus Berkelbacteria bacterium]|nr:MAG: pyridoxamine 5'-phosphate oxidase family protein [Candidatus Berkelbacteria bacterium]QQG51960.1 MAG: pyridoxamine 5'-phosphate oxidase family protein [Candidatus Berkelbacteria bacterium]